MINLPLSDHSCTLLFARQGLIVADHRRITALQMN